MTSKSQMLMVGVAAILAGVSPAPATAAEDHVVLTPEEVEWGPSPPALPKGAEAAVLYGDPSKEGQFALRVKLPNGYHIPPHTHPVQEIVTVVSGTFKLGQGETADQNEAQALPAGGFFSLPPGMAHYAYTDEETVVQINSTGPWALTYVDPADDPRKTN
jgi:quercetin dioxygenase-like cupin family protein